MSYNSLQGRFKCFECGNVGNATLSYKDEPVFCGSCYCEMTSYSRFTEMQEIIAEIDEIENSISMGMSSLALYKLSRLKDSLKRNEDKGVIK